MKTLITGGAGFIGLHLARHLLAEGHDVDLVDNFSRAVRDRDLDDVTRSGVRLLDHDLLDATSWQDLDTDYELVFHLAAIVGVAQVLRSSYAVLDANIGMTSSALAFATRQESLERFVFASTSEVYAGTLEQYGLEFPTPETTPLTLPETAKPRTSYMLSKIVGEAFCQQSAVPFTIVRPHNVYGPRMGLSHVVPELMQRAVSLQEGQELEVFSPDHRRTFCYVEDAVTLIAGAAQSEQGVGATLNVGVDEPEVTILDLAHEILDVVGASASVLEGATHPGSPVRRQPAIDAVVDVTGKRPQISLREGLERTYAWYSERVFSGSEQSAR